MQQLLRAGAVLVVSTVSAQSLQTHTLSPLAVHPSENPSLPASALDYKLRLAEQQQELGKALSKLPGVSLRSQGAHGSEPVIRGLGWERVTTQYNGLSLHGACPSRMDPPVSLFNPASLNTSRVELGPPSVIHGPLSTGGRILLDNELDFAHEAKMIRDHQLLGGVGSAGKARNGQLSLGSATDARAWELQLGADKQTDYVSADGTRVPARAASENAAAQWKGRLGDTLILDLGTRWVYDQDVDYPSLPMDSRYAKTNLYTGALSWQADVGSLRELRLRAGAETVDHLMDNRDKANRMMMQASTPSTADSFDTGILSRWQLPQGELRAGMDAAILQRDALRTRTLRSTGASFQDPIWPDLEQRQAGIFGEWEGQLGDGLRLRAGTRIDHQRSDAGKADAVIVPGPGIGKTTVARAWEDVGGAQSGDPEQEDTLLSGNLQFTRDFSEDWMLQLGLGRTEAAPNLTQRYLSFGPVPGGYGVGTPDLDPETKYEIELRSEGRLGAHRLGMAGFYARIEDYLLPTTVAMADVDADGKTDRIKGTVNRDAEMWGLEAGLDLQLTRQVSAPLSLSWVRGRTADGRQDLPEIPPLEIQAALRWQGEQAKQPYAEFGLRFANKQDHIDPAFGEDSTPSYAVLHLRGGLELVEGLRIEAGIENLLDRNYHEHLTREALLPAGDLARGDEVPQPGRNFTLSARYRW